MYHEAYDKAKKIIKQDACMKFYDTSKLLYLKTDASGSSLCAGLLQVRDSMNCRLDEVPSNTVLHPIKFTNKSLYSTEWQYSNVKWEALGILHGLDKFQYYCFVKEVNVITNHKPLVAMVSKDIATLSQCLQPTILHIHQYSVNVLCMSGPDLYIADWLSHHNHTENKDQEIADMEINICTLSMAIGIPTCISIEDTRNVMSINTELQMLQTYIIRGWTQNKVDLRPTLHKHWPIRHDLAIIDQCESCYIEHCQAMCHVPGVTSECSLKKRGYIM